MNIVINISNRLNLSLFHMTNTLIFSHSSYFRQSPINIEIFSLLLTLRLVSSICNHTQSLAFLERSRISDIPPKTSKMPSIGCLSSALYLQYQRYYICKDLLSDLPLIPFFHRGLRRLVLVTQKGWM